MKARSLADLQTLRDALQRKEREQAELLARQRAAHAAAQRAQQLFSETVGKVTPLPQHGRVAPSTARPQPLPLQRRADERAALQEAMSDEVDLETLLLTDDGLSFRRPRVGPDVVTRLRRGQWAIQAQIDLHGLRRDEARERLAAFIRSAAQRGHRCLRFVHGKGLGSPGKSPVLKSRVQRWLVQKKEVLAFVQARPMDGGAGALVVLLQPVARKNT